MTQSPLRDIDAAFYESSSKGAPVEVATMHWKHLVNAKKVLLRKWAVYKAALKRAAETIRGSGGDPVTNASVDLATIYESPGALFPVYDSICDEIEARNEKRAVELAESELLETPNET